MRRTTWAVNPWTVVRTDTRVPEKQTYLTLLAWGLLFPLLLSVLAPCWVEAADDRPLPAFSDYPVSEAHNLEPVPVDLSSHPKARMFRTGLRQAAQERPRFAGHYAVAQLGCGTGCSTVALVNLRSGRLLFPEELDPLSFPWLPDEKETMNRYGVDYRKDSALLVVHGSTAKHGKLGSYYFKMQDDQLRLIAVSEWKSRWNKTDANRAKE